MFHHKYKQSYFTRLTRTYPVLKAFDIYDRQSFVREYVLDNTYLCIFAYVLFYVAIWYATKAIKRIEKKNKKLMETVVSNRTKLDDVMALKDKRAEYENIVVKAKGAQKVTAKHLDNEMKRLSTELIATGNKMAELEKILEKCKFGEKYRNRGEGNHGTRERSGNEQAEAVTDSLEDFKILEPSFPPTVPPEPPPRKYGIFVTRPPGQRLPPTPRSPASKIGFK
ncbi:uncharacterized protein [Venturia canescens]|uniref:uncharacterized protein n=1 Tax=Venturia canescens TaxID=32260 RepID=UPI001C9CD38D|nr:uncharacterized protein LOC122415236 [Venturia canescens]